MSATATPCSSDDLDAVEAPARLFAALDTIQTEGWDSSTGDVLLTYALRNVVRPAVRAAGLGGAAAESAEATGWSTAWEALSNPAIRATRSPWGFVTAAVRRAVISDRIGDRYRTAAHTAWRIERYREARTEGRRRPAGEWSAVADPDALARPWSLTALLEDGWDEPAAEEDTATDSPLVEMLVATLARGGWPAAVAREVVLHVADYGLTNQPDRAEVPGWRPLATALGIPPWQARRLTALLLGAPGWPGLVERLATGGPTALDGPAIEVAVRSTRDRSLHTPARAALTAPSAEPSRQLAS